MSIKNENRLEINIKDLLEYRSANIPVIGSSGAKVNLLVAKTPAIAKGELSEVSPAIKNSAITVNQSPINEISFAKNNFLKVLFFLNRPR